MAHAAEFFPPLRRGWDHMTRLLFSPFNIGRWFMLGFTAWLARLADSNGDFGNSFTGGGDGDTGDWDMGPAIESAGNFIQDVIATAAGLAIGIVVLLLFLAFLAVLLWISSRGKFMFLDNVIHNRTEVSQPWKEFTREGDSLFLFRVVFNLIGIAILVTAVILFLMLTGIDIAAGFGGGLTVFSIVVLAMLGLFLVIPLSFVNLYLDDFVVPLMYKHRISCTQAWARFFDLFAREWVAFLLYGFFVVFLAIVFVVGLMTLTVMTCCIGLLLVAIPYIGTVVTLPVWVTYRAFSLEFLAQFGDAYRVLPEREPPMPPPAPIPDAGPGPV